MALKLIIGKCLPHIEVEKGGHDSPLSGEKVCLRQEGVNRLELPFPRRDKWHFVVKGAVQGGRKENGEGSVRKKTGQKLKRKKFSAVPSRWIGPGSEMEQLDLLGQLKILESDIVRDGEEDLFPGIASMWSETLTGKAVSSANNTDHPGPRARRSQHIILEESQHSVNRTANSTGKGKEADLIADTELNDFGEAEGSGPLGNTVGKFNSGKVVSEARPASEAVALEGEREEKPSGNEGRIVQAAEDKSALLPLKLVIDAGVSSLPHPSRVSRGTEDAHFLEQNWFGVADGIACWAEQGVNSGLYSQELTWNCVELIRSEEYGADPKAVLVDSHARTELKGTCTITLGVLDGRVLKMASIGDSGFLVLRQGQIISRSERMQHGFNCPFQIGCNVGDDPSDAMLYEVAVAEGDILVMGSDGLFDNLFQSDIVSLVYRAISEGKNLEAVAKLVAMAAQKTSESSTALTPICEDAKQWGEHFEGGKKDDVTVLVALVKEQNV